MKPKTKKIKKHNDKIESLSIEQKKIRLKIENSKNSENIIELKKKRRNIQKVKKREQNQRNKEEIEDTTNEIISSKHD